MTKKVIKATMLSIALAVMCMMSSCSDSKDQLLSTIPAENMLVINVDGAKLLDAIDTSVEDGTVSMPNGLVERMKLDKSDAKAIENIGKFAANIDYNNIIFSMTNTEDFYYTFIVKNQEGLIDVAINDLSLNTVNVEEPYKAYETNGITLLIKDNQAWIAPKIASETVKLISSQLEKAEKENYAGNSGVKNEFTASDELFTGVLAIANGGASCNYLVMNGGIKDNAINLNAFVIDNDGNKLTSDGGTINTDFLKYATPDMDAFAAIYVSKDTNWDAILAPMMLQAGQIATIAEAAKPYLKSIDGTVFIACKVPDNAELVGATGKAVPCIIQIPMDTQKANELADLCFQAYDIPKSMLDNNGSGLYSISAGGSSVYFGTYNGTLTFATVDPAQTTGNNESIKSLFEGKTMAASFKLPNLMPYMKGCNFGIDATASLSGDEFNINVKLLGTQEPILLALIYGLIDSEK